MKGNEIQVVKDAMLKVGMDVETIAKECSFAVQIINKSKQLKASTIESQQAAIINIAQCGLTLNPVMKLAYLVPRWSPQGTQCCLEPSYQGLVKLLTDTGSVVAINAQLVYAEDEFEVNAADFNNPITHKPKPFAKDRGVLVGVYAIAQLPNGTFQAETMSIEEVYEIRERSESYKAFIAKKITTCVWITDEGEMVRKTICRRIVKYLPKTDKFKKAAIAISLDEQDYKASESSKTFARSLLENSDIIERIEMGAYEHSIDFANSEQVAIIIQELKLRQRPGTNLNAGEVHDIVKEKVKRPNS